MLLLRLENYSIITFDMKKALLTVVFLCASFIAGYSQGKESLGDKAMASGNYEQAVEYYMAAMNENPTEALSAKLTKATMLKTEFKAIDEAIAVGNVDEAEVHIANVLTIDPGNKFVDDKRRQLSKNVTKIKTDNFNKGLKGIFIGDEEKQRIFGFLSVDQGIGITMVPGLSGNQGVTSVQRFQLKLLSAFPVVLDFQTQMGWTQNQVMWGLGGGSCFFIGDHVTLDYGIGLQRNRMSFNANEKGKGYYYRAGVSFMGDKNIGLSYAFNRNVNRDMAPFNSHQITLLVGIGDNIESSTTCAILGGSIVIWHLLANIFFIYPRMYKQ